MRLTDFDAILFDMDGTLYHEQYALPGAAAMMTRLRDLDLPWACVTNNSANTSDELAARLGTMGISVEPSHIHTAAHDMAQRISQLRARRVFNFAGRALPTLLEAVQWLEAADPPADVVAVATHMRENDVGFDFDRALCALAHLRAGATLVVGCNDRVFPIAGGVEFGSGAWAALFRFAADLPAERVVYCGKPQPGFFRGICEQFGVDPTRCLLIGDNLESDIRGGRDAGMTTALLWSGVTRPGDLKRSDVKPDVIHDDLATLLDAIRSRPRRVDCGLWRFSHMVQTCNWPPRCGRWSDLRKAACAWRSSGLPPRAFRACSLMRRCPAFGRASWTSVPARTCWRWSAAMA